MKVCCCPSQQGACGGVPVPILASAFTTILAVISATFLQVGYFGGAVITGILGTSYIGFNYFFSGEQKNATCIEDQSGNIDNEIHSSSDGSYIFSKGGKNTLVGAENAVDRFFFSMCSTRESTIKNFEDGLDKIHLFCTKKQISPGQLLLELANGNSYLTVNGLEDRQVNITVLGEHNDLLNDVTLNEKYGHYCN